MVILGNGFDLACGLPTSYNDFFKHRFNHLNHEYSMIEELFKPRISSAKAYFYEYKKEIDRLTVNTVSYNKLGKKLEAMILNDIDSFHNEIVKCSAYLIKTKLTFWDLFFYFLYYDRFENNDANWNNIESQIEDFLNLKNKQINLNITTGDPDRYLNMKVKIHDSYEEPFFDNVIKDVKKEEIMKTLIYHFIKKKTESYDIYEMLFDELVKFERGFSDYVSYIMKSTKIKNSNTQTEYRDNLIEIIHKSKSDDIYILNFNYTFFKSISQTNDINHYYKSFDIKRKDRLFKISENNVHGQYHTSTIFGIDQDVVNSEEKLYVFTKTYRKMRNQEDIPSIEIPKPESISEIIFYGHSLSKADYSYFQSIFDYYDIYRSTIKLVFKYSNYDKHDLNGTVKAKYLDSVVKLIKFYGSKMMDNNHGNNLIHKLLLENRLSIEEVYLKRIDILTR